VDVHQALERIGDVERSADLDEALARCEELAVSLPTGTSDAERADVLWRLADLRSAADRHDAASEAYEECLPLLDRLERRRDAAIAANNLAYHHAQAGRKDRALACILDALERYRRIGAQPDLLRAHENVGFHRLERGEFSEAESSFRNAVQQARALGDPAELGTCLLWLGRALVREGRSDRALLAFTEANACLARAASPLEAEARDELASIRSVRGGAR
jgi:tetratricopeptide (TPR) repeat protein